MPTAPPGRATSASSPATTVYDARPPTARALQLALAVAARAEISSASASSSRSGHAVRRPHGGRADDTDEGLLRRVRGGLSTPRLCSSKARTIKTEQEIERMRLANELAALAMEHVPGAPAPGDDRGRGRGALGGTRARSSGSATRARSGWPGVLACRSGPGIRTFTATGHRPVAGPRADAVRDLGLRRRLLVRPHEESLPRRAARGRTLELLDDPARRLRGRLAIHRRRRRTAPRDRSASSPGSHRRGRLSGPAQRTRSATGSAPARTSRPTLTGRARDRFAARHGARASSRPSSGPAAEASGLEDNFLVTRGQRTRSSAPSRTTSALLEVGR